MEKELYEYYLEDEKILTKEFVKKHIKKFKYNNPFYEDYISEENIDNRIEALEYLIDNKIITRQYARDNLKYFGYDIAFDIECNDVSDYTEPLIKDNKSFIVNNINSISIECLMKLIKSKLNKEEIVYILNNSDKALKILTHPDFIYDLYMPLKKDLHDLPILILELSRYFRVAKKDMLDYFEMDELNDAIINSQYELDVCDWFFLKKYLKNFKWHSDQIVVLHHKNDDVNLSILNKCLL